MAVLMRARVGSWVGIGLITAASAVAPAQLPAVAAAPQTAGIQVGGRSSVDLVMVRAGSPGVPLRHGRVISGSERVSLGGRALQRGVEYSIDNGAGVVYLMVPGKPGQAVSVAYRYDPAAASQPTETGLGGLRPFTFNLAPGAGVTMGFGLTERTADGQVLTNNVYGLNNALNFGSGSLKGLYLVGERTQENSDSMFEYADPGRNPDSGRSEFILQSLQTQLGRGTLKLDYQDISKNFSAFSAVRNSGMDARAVDQLSKERGLSRMGLSLQNLQLGSLGFSSDYRTVGDDNGGVEWRSMGMTAGAFKLNWRTQDVEKNFTRFKDLAEGDREQLAREAGLRREFLDGSWASSAGLLSYNSFLVEDGDDRGIRRNEVKFDGSKFRFMTGEQEIERGFTRFDSLFEQEKGQWGREVGLKRQWTALEAAIFGGGGPLKFSSSEVSSQTGKFEAMDASIGGKGWSLQHVGREVDQGFGSLGSLTQAELDGHVDAISRMYVNGGLPFRPEERPWLLQSAGLSREATRFTAMPFANWNLAFEQIGLRGKQDEGSVESLTLDGKALDFTYRKQELGANFTELPTMLELERQRLGTMPGLSRTDLGMKADLRGGKLELSQTNADSPTGGMDRKTLKYSGRDLQFNLNAREVDPTFRNVGQVLDPEAGLLAGMVGFNETDASLNWRILPNLRVEAMSFNGSSEDLDQERAMSQLLLAWAPDRLTQLEYSRFETTSEDSSSLLFMNSVERMSLARNLGRFGNLKLARQLVEFDGRNATQPSSDQTSLAFETKLDAKTSIKTEQSRTKFDNGDKEDVSANTLTTEIGRAAGLSVTDVNIDRRGDDRDEKKSNVGFWLSLWGGVRLNVGVADQLNDWGASTGQRNYSLTPGTIGNLQIASATYNANTWEQGDRLQAMGNISLSTAKAFDLGFLKDVKLALGQDTAEDQGRWLKENRHAGLAGRIGKNVFSFDYRGQMNHQEQRGVDRTFALTTDPAADKLKIAASYKLRTLPGDKIVAIRNFNVSAKPAKNVELSHQLITHPEVARPDLLLGSDPQPMSVNKWKLDYVSGPDLKVSGSWEEQRNDQTHMLSRLGGVTVTLFEGKGSPLSLFYGVEQFDGNVPKRSVDRWSLRYDQRPGPNQVMSIFMGNVTYGHTIAPNEKRHNLSATLEYQLKF